MADVFISYSREDAAEAERLAGALEAAGYSCWWDRNLVSGSRYLAETEAQLKGSKAVVVIWSKVSVMSHWVADEAAVGRDESRLAALSFDGSMPPLGFRQFQVTDFAGWRGGAEEAAFCNLLAGLDRLVPRGVVGGPVAAAPAPSTRGNLPLRLSPLIGRQAELTEIARLIDAERLLTLTGPGGIGKTRLAIEVARQAAPGHQDGAWLVELAPISDSSAIPGAIARAMGIELRDEPSREIVERLRTWQALIVLDNCEHVIEAASGLIEQILQHAPDVFFLVTSQEVLGLDGERVVRLRSLNEHDAEALFLRSARAVEPEFSPTADEVPLVRTICARLDGIALAIEMAAARAPSLGVALLSQRLDDRFRTLSGGRRTALPRHRTLQATLDWSHSLLRSEEAAVFRRLSVFVGGFNLPAAREVVSDERIDPLAVEAILEGLCAKSLVVRDRHHASVRYRLLETTRIYAQQRLAEVGEAQPLAIRHAAFFEGMCREAYTNYYVGEGRDEVYLELYGRNFGNVERAIEWCFGPDGDRLTGLSLLAHAIIVFFYNGRQKTLVRWINEHGLSGDPAPEELHQKIISNRVTALGGITRLTPEIVDDALRQVPAGSAPLPRAALLVNASWFFSITGQAERVAANKRELLSLGFRPGSRIMLWSAFPELFLLEASPVPDRTEIRSLANAVRVEASQRGFEDFVLSVMVFGWSSEFCWHQAPDTMIDHVKQAVSQHLVRDDGVTYVTIINWVVSRLIMALCKRGREEDVTDSKSLVQQVRKRFGFGETVADFCALACIALAEGRAVDAARVLGCANVTTAAGIATTEPFLLRTHKLVRAAMSEEAYPSALLEGARLSLHEAYDLAMATGRADGGRRG